MLTTVIPYHDDNTPLEGFVAYPSNGKFPAVILCHTWKGRDEFICKEAEKISSYGYVGFALDLYGQGVLGHSKEENTFLKKPFLENRYLLNKRLLKAFDVVCNLPFVDANRIAVLGFGFGGLCALDLARSGVNLKGSICVHGHYTPPPEALIKPIKAKVLIIHGYNDPITPQEELLTFEKELQDAQVDWQTHLYGNAMHAFTVPTANDPQSGVLYNPIASSRSQKAIHSFLHEILASDPI